MANAHTNFDAISPARNAKSVTPHDSTNLTFVAKALRVGTAGAVSVEMVGEGDTTHTTIIPTVLAGETLPVQVTRVNNTGTTASGITAYY